MPTSMPSGSIPPLMMNDPLLPSINDPNKIVGTSVPSMKTNPISINEPLPGSIPDLTMNSTPTPLPPKDSGSTPPLSTETPSLPPQVDAIPSNESTSTSTPQPMKDVMLTPEPIDPMPQVIPPKPKVKKQHAALQLFSQGNIPQAHILDTLPVQNLPSFMAFSTPRNMSNKVVEFQNATNYKIAGKKVTISQDNLLGQKSSNEHLHGSYQNKEYVRGQKHGHFGQLDPSDIGQTEKFQLFSKPLSGKGSTENANGIPKCAPNYKYNNQTGLCQYSPNYAATLNSITKQGESPGGFYKVQEGGANKFA